MIITFMNGSFIFHSTSEVARPKALSKSFDHIVAIRCFVRYYTFIRQNINLHSYIVQDDIMHASEEKMNVMHL